MKTKISIMLIALILCLSAFSLPVFADSQVENYTSVSFVEVTGKDKKSANSTNDNNSATKKSDEKQETQKQDQATTEEDVSVIPEGAFSIEGTGTVLDKATDADDKQFFTITTDAGNTFYLVVDGKRDNKNVYFLNSVTESDLMALAEKDNDVSISSAPKVETCVCIDKCETGHVNTDCNVCKNDLSKCTGKAAEIKPLENEKEPEPEKDSGTGTIIFVLVAVIAIACAGYYFKIVRPKKQIGFEDDGFEDDDFEDDDFNEEIGDYGEEDIFLEDDDLSE